MSIRILTIVLSAGLAWADEDDLDASTLRERGHLLYGNTAARVVGVGSYQTGFNPTHFGAGAFTRVSFGAAFEGGYLGLFTSLGTLQGIEFRVTAGYSLAEQYAEGEKTPGSGGLLFKPEARWLFCPRFLRFNTWRVMAATGIGLELDGARWSDTWRAFAHLGLRLQAFFSKESSVSLEWGWMPGTLNKEFTLRRHQAELTLAFGQVHVGGRLGIDLTGTVVGAGVAWQGSLVGGYAF